MKLLLWDIDGTLLDAGETSYQRFHRGVCVYLGCDIPQLPVEHVAGSTDPIILENILRENGVPEGEITDAVPTIISWFDTHFTENEAIIRSEIVVHPGATDLLTILHTNDDVVNTLVTGNLRHVAEMKLTYADLMQFVNADIGAYSTDSPIRSDLPPLAKKRTEELYGAINTDDIWVIGDSVGDYQCAQSVGAHTLLVGTSGQNMDELRSLGADAVLDDLSNIDGVMELLLN